MGRNSVTCQKFIDNVVAKGICIGCGGCISSLPSSKGQMVLKDGQLLPSFAGSPELPAFFWEACPGKGIDYPALYLQHYGTLPVDWRVGTLTSMWTGYAADNAIRSAGASGGVLTAVLIHLLKTRRIDGAILVKQGVASPERAGYVIARTPEEILECAQSVYVPVPTLEALRDVVPGETYAMTSLPEQSAMLRVLQHNGHSAAKQVRYVLGPYAGTSLEYGAIDSLVRMNNISADDSIVSLKWRAGDWPGYLEIVFASGRIIRSPKVYYNFLIPFYVNQMSLQSSDFANEFSDLAVGDAWSPKYEKIGKGFSVVTVRSSEMQKIIEEMLEKDLLCLSQVASLEASSMHGHMIDFKKRGAYLRNQWRHFTGRAAPDCGLKPVPLGLARVLVEVVTSGIFIVCRTRTARWCMERVPVYILGPLFNKLRLAWKAASKPTKRKSLGELEMIPSVPFWKKND